MCIEKKKHDKTLQNPLRHNHHFKDIHIVYANFVVSIAMF